MSSGRYAPLNSALYRKGISLMQADAARRLIRL